MFSVKRFLFGTLAISLVGSAFHFVYDLLGGSVLAAPLFAVNESVWEHMKLLSTAALAWMTADWFLVGKQARARFFAARAAALPLGLVAIPMLYYFFLGAFGLENVMADIGIFVVAAALYQYIAMRLETRLNAGREAIGAAVLVAIVVLFAVFTFLPPHLPLFLDTPTGTYGIPG